MSICLIGRSTSGKDTIKKILVEDFDYIPIITTTTRPMREGEVNGVDYFFVTDEQFNEMIAQDEFAEYREYKTKHGIWKYGSKKKDYVGDHKVIILTPDGYEKIKSCSLSDMKSIYLHVDDKILKARASQRDKYDKKEARRRYKHDKKDFKGFEEKADYIIDNSYVNPYTVAAIVNDIDEIKKGK